jgi:internalin A
MNNFFSQRTFISLLGFVFLSFSLSFCQEMQQVLTMQKKATATLIAYFETLVSKNILSIANLKYVSQQDCLVNPIFEEQAHSSDEIFTHRKQIDQLIEKSQNFLFDSKEIKKWAIVKMRDLAQQSTIRDTIYEKTRDLHKNMAFVAIPAGTSISDIDGSQFVIAEGIEIQETPMTQWQWVQLVKTNPSHFIEGFDSEDRELGGNNIKMLADYPVENLSYEQVETCIKALNERDNEYYYSLPSVYEFEAVLQSALGKAWLQAISQLNSCNDLEKTCVVGQAPYLSVLGKRVYDVIGNVWQMTRDRTQFQETGNGYLKGIWQKLTALRKFFIKREEGCSKYDGGNVKARLVFGSSYNTHKDSLTDMKAMTRPLFCKESRDTGVGFRLVRCKKNQQSNSMVRDHRIAWDEKSTAADNHWDMDKDNAYKTIVFTEDMLPLVLEHPERYPQELQHACAKILEASECNDSGCLRALRYLSRVDNQINDLSLISYLKNLETLYLSGNKLVGISPLSRLVNLHDLVLSDNNITDIQPLARLTHLQELYLAYNVIKNLSHLAHLTQLASLTLDRNMVEDISPLNNLVNLSTLSLSHNPIKDLEPLRKLVDLSKLSLENSTISDLEPLASLATLRELNLAGNRVRDVSPLAHLTNLHHLDLRNNSIDDISPLKNLKLDYLHLGNNAIRDITPLITMTSLYFLILDNNLIDDISPLLQHAHLQLPLLGTATVLTQLFLRGNQISDVSSLKNFIGLKSLFLDNNRITDISPLANLPKLSTISLSGNPILDIAPLKPLKSLERLGLDSDQIIKLKPNQILTSNSLAIINVNDQPGYNYGGESDE